MPVYRRKYTDKKTGKTRYGHYYYKFDIDGLTYKKTIKEARTKPQAEEVERQKRQDVYDGVYGAKQKPQLFEKFVQEVYLPWCDQHHAQPAGAHFRATALCEYFGDKTLPQISPMMIEGYKQQRQKHITHYGTRLQNSSINTELFTLSGILTMAVTNKLIRENPCRKVPHLDVAKKPPRRLSSDEEEKLVAVEDPPYMGRMIQTAIWTGFRQCELIALEKSSVNFERNRIYLTKTKWKCDMKETFICRSLR